jgi:hypothetical protein
MAGTVKKLLDFRNTNTSAPNDFCIGRIVRIEASGQVLVDFPGNPSSPVKARLIAGTPLGDSLEDNASVLLVFENGNPALPIILGIVHDTRNPVREVALEVERPKDAIIDGEKIIFDAKDEIVLKCGESTVSLYKDGRIIIKGVQITSRASKVNKIKGAAILIN